MFQLLKFLFRIMEMPVSIPTFLIEIFPSFIQFI
jgi:hypothetical protein